MAPVSNRRYLTDDNHPHPEFLRDDGPFLNVLVHVPSALAKLFENQNLPVPAPQAGLALIDTGASHTCVHEPALTALGLNPIGATTSRTAAGLTAQRLYPVRLEFPGEGIDREFTSVAGVNLIGQSVVLNTGEKDIIVLVGRDVMQEWVLIYNGPIGVVTIAF